jgi:GcrA cell cycle regulator
MTVTGTPNQIANATWTSERVDLLKSYVEAGLSCAQIAGEIGVTRNAVIGKISRLGLSRGRRAAGPMKHTAQWSRRPAMLNRRRIFRALYTEVPLLTEQQEIVASPDRCSLLDLAEDKCRWPLGDPEARDFSFCANCSVPRLSYCAAHARLAYRTTARLTGIGRSSETAS